MHLASNDNATVPSYANINMKVKLLLELHLQSVENTTIVQWD